MTDEFWYKVAPFVSASRNYYEQLDADYEGARYDVCANLYSEEASDYIAHYDGAVFDNYEFAYDFWAGWMPDMKEVRRDVREFHEDGYSEHYEIEVGVWEDGNDLEFYNETVTGWKE